MSMRESPNDYYDRLRREDDGRYTARNAHSLNPTDCDHDMRYSGSLGVVGGQCVKCVYSTL